MTKGALFDSSTFHGNLENALSARAYEFNSGQYNIIFDDLIFGNPLLAILSELLIIIYVDS